jgi:putative heme degradation protein
MNKDRGTIKWTAMMLPEHVKLLREWQQEDQFVEKLQLDDAQMEQLNTNLQRAYSEHRPIELKVWEETSIYMVSGIIKKINTQEQYIQLENGQKFSFHLLCDASIDE